MKNIMTIKIDHVTNLESKSHPVKTGEVQEQESDEVLTQTDDSNVRASGVGTALLVLVPKEENSEAAYDKILCSCDCGSSTTDDHVFDGTEQHGRNVFR